MHAWDACMVFISDHFGEQELSCVHHRQDAYTCSSSLHNLSHFSTNLYCHPRSSSGFQNKPSNPLWKYPMSVAINYIRLSLVYTTPLNSLQICIHIPEFLHISNKNLRTPQTIWNCNPVVGIFSKCLSSKADLFMLLQLANSRKSTNLGVFPKT